MIETTDDLVQLCRRLARHPHVAVDTEFMRETTYWPKLCVVQLAAGGEAALIDALAPGLDLAPLFDLMRAPGAVKVFHAGRQDLEIFYHLGRVLPTPLFDTQVAAMVCGFGDQVGYDKLMRDLLKVHIDKGTQYTDWYRRPLSERQVRYALDDVIYLESAYELLTERLRASGRERWVDEEMAVLAEPTTYLTPVEDAWRRLKTRSQNRRYLAILRAVTAWRETEARTRDVPRNRVLRDDVLTAIAAEAPETPDQLGRVRAVPKSFPERAEGAALIAAVKRAKALPERELPVPDAIVDLPRGLGPIVDLLKVVLKLKADEAGVAQKLIANGDDLDRIALDDQADVPALKGWRRALFGADALAVKHGRLALAANGRRLKLVAIDASGAA
jgi:ribonuclease D